MDKIPMQVSLIHAACRDGNLDQGEVIERVCALVKREAQIAHIEENFQLFADHQDLKASNGTEVRAYFDQYANKPDLYENLCSDLYLNPEV